MEKNRTPLIIGILAAFGLLHGPTLDRQPQHASEHIARKDQAEETTVRSRMSSQKENKGLKKNKSDFRKQPLKTLYDYFLTTDGASEEQIAPGELLSRNNSSVRFLIATVPDPIDSRFAYVFDRNIESIKQAVGQSDYIPDRFWLPWQEGSGDAENGGDWVGTLEGKKEQGASDLLNIRVGREAEERWRTEPGILLFREKAGRRAEKPNAEGIEKKDRSKRRLLVVFLIGENPTWGLNKIAFAKCFDYIEAVVGSSTVETTSDPLFLEALPSYNQFKSGKSPCIHILGPSFSGTARSLADSISVQLQLKRNFKFSVVTGSAMGAFLPRMFEKEFENDPVRFRSTVENGTVLEETFFEYLKNEFHIKPDRIALLIESDTAFGGSLAMKRVKKSDEETKKPEEPEPLQLLYPMHISRLRSEYEKDPLLKSLQLQQTGTMPRQGLEMRMDESGGKPQDGIPNLSDLTSVSVELVLSELVSAIAENEIQFVGLTGTDERDNIFLGRMIKKYCHDVRFFTLGADVLYLHPDINQDFQGMIAVTSYPLFGENQKWTASNWNSRLRRPFNNDRSEGVYNACRLLLADMKQAEDAGSTQARGSLKLSEYVYDGSLWDHTIVEGRKPPVWLTVLGRDAYWPIAALPPQNDPDPTAAQKSTAMRNSSSLKDAPESNNNEDESHKETKPELEMPWIFLIFGVSIAVFSLMHAVYIFLWWRSPDPSKNWRFFRSFRPRADSGWLLQQKVYLAMASSALIVTFAMLLVLCDARVLFAHQGPWQCPYWVACFVCLYILIASVITTLLKPRKSATGTFGVLFSGAMLISLAFAFLIRFSLSPDSPEGAFLVERSIHLSNGVSPVLPILILCGLLYYWAYAQLRRLRFLEERNVSLPFEYIDEGLPKETINKEKARRLFGNLESLSVIAASLRGVLGAPLVGGKFEFIFILASAAAYGLFVAVDFHTLEGMRFDWLYLAMFLGLNGLVMMVFCRFLLTWKHLSRLLRGLEGSSAALCFQPDSPGIFMESHVGVGWRRTRLTRLLHKPTAGGNFHLARIEIPEGQVVGVDNW